MTTAHLGIKFSAKFYSRERTPAVISGRQAQVLMRRSSGLANPSPTLPISRRMAVMRGPSPFPGLPVPPDPGPGPVTDPEPNPEPEPGTGPDIFPEPGPDRGPGLPGM